MAKGIFVPEIKRNISMQSLQWKRWLVCVCCCMWRER